MNYECPLLFLRNIREIPKLIWNYFFFGGPSLVDETCFKTMDQNPVRAHVYDTVKILSFISHEVDITALGWPSRQYSHS